MYIHIYTFSFQNHRNAPRVRTPRVRDYVRYLHTDKIRIYKPGTAAGHQKHPAPALCVPLPRELRRAALRAPLLGLAFLHEAPQVQVQQQRVPVRGLAGAGRLEVPGLSGREERQTRLLPLAKRRHAERLVNLCVNSGFPPCCGTAQQT